MPDNNQEPNLKVTSTDRPVDSGQVIQPTSSSVSPASPRPLSSPAKQISLQSPPQPNGAVNGQSFSQQTPVSRSQIEQLSDQKPSKWRYFFIVLGILQALGVALFFLVMSSVVGKTGGEFVALLLFITLVPAVGLIAFINLIGLPIYMRKHKPSGKWLVFSILSLVISVILALYGAYSVYQMRVAVPKHINELSEQSRQKSEQRQQEFAAAKTRPDITKEEAISFMQNCKADYFVGYTDINLVKEANTKSWLNKAEQSSTGIEILEGSPKSYVFASKSMTAALQDTARQLRQSCYNTKKLYITTDEWIETEYPQGKWTRVKQ